MYTMYTHHNNREELLSDVMMNIPQSNYFKLANISTKPPVFIYLIRRKHLLLV